MSFTREINRELIVRPPEARRCCRRSELTALVLLRGFLVLSEGQRYIKVAAGSSTLARHLFQMIKGAGFNSPRVVKQQGRRLGKVTYMVQVQGGEAVDNLLGYLGLYPLRGQPGFTREIHRELKFCCRRAFLRGIFLAGGSMSISRSGYHLEINCGYREDAILTRQILQSFGIESLFGSAARFIIST